MATPQLIDVEALLAEIPGDSPCGADIREDPSPNSLYYQIKDARAEARAAERRAQVAEEGEQDADAAAAWQQVLKLAPKILTEQAKDLEIAAWYMEALLRAHGFPGLRDGVRLAHGLVERYWDDLFPRPDEDGLETRTAPLAGLNGEDADGTLIAPLNQIPITEGYTYGPFATWQYQQAYELDKITDPEKREARIEAGSASMDKLRQSVIETPAAFFRTLADDVDECLSSLSDFATLMSEKCEGNGPPTSNIRNTLSEVREVVGFLAKDALGSAAEEDAVNAEPAVFQGGAAAAKEAVSMSGAITSREQAQKILMKVAEFYRRTEPHSPVSYAVEQALRWAQMTLPELLAVLVPDESARAEYFRLAGIPQPSND